MNRKLGRLSVTEWKNVLKAFGYEKVKLLIGEGIFNSLALEDNFHNMDITDTIHYSINDCTISFTIMKIKYENVNYMMDDVYTLKRLGLKVIMPRETKEV